MTDLKIQIDVDNINISIIRNLLNSMIIYIYQSHYLNNNILTLYLSQKPNYNTHIKFSDNLILKNKNIVWKKDIILNLDEYKHVLEIYKTLNSSIMRFLDGENIKTITIKIHYVLNTSNIDDIYTTFNNVVDNLITSKKIDIIVFICLVKLYYSYDFYDNCFDINIKNYNDLETLIKSDITLESLNIYQSTQPLIFTSRYYNYKFTDAELISIFDNNILLSKNKNFINAPDVKLLKLCEYLLKGIT